MLPEAKGSNPRQVTVLSARHFVDALLYGNRVPINSNGQLSMLIVIDSNWKTCRDVMKLTLHASPIRPTATAVRVMCQYCGFLFRASSLCSLITFLFVLKYQKHCVTVHLLLRPVAVLDNKFVTVMMTTQATWQRALPIEQQQIDVLCCSR